MKNKNEETIKTKYTKQERSWEKILPVIYALVQREFSRIDFKNNYPIISKVIGSFVWLIGFLLALLDLLIDWPQMV